MVRAKITLDMGYRKFYPRRLPQIRPVAVHRLKEDVTWQTYSARVSELLQSSGTVSELSTADRWSVLRDSLCKGASDILGYGRCKQPDWFNESENTLLPLLDARNTARAVLLQKGTRAARRRFRRCQNTVQLAVAAAMEAWIERISLQAEAEHSDCGERWRCIQQLQGVAAGWRCLRPMAVFDEGGSLTCKSI